MPIKPPLDPNVADEAPKTPILTGYDEEHFVTYLRLLDAAAEDADWREVARVVLHMDPDREPNRATQSLGNPPGAGALDDDDRISISSSRRRAALTLQGLD
ncbi:hypothetical protein ATER59S_00110 [Aquamicrobium terrae]|jgi:hypothetical protein